MRKLSGMEQVALSLAFLQPGRTVHSQSIRIASMVMEGYGYLDRIPGLEPKFVITDAGRAILAEASDGN